ncbi:alpha/beta fold hydrolase [Microbacterium sp. BK668]|uniref:alpha/beta fold hydrolase n=1 Tax=Microbacterium sp. BK668 TaxID=2512118 RepID=UPI00105EE5E7|nr:alpha/beta fold hydrolase [Microbacterium sp. BK668]TDN87729.1 cation diffusion facilitator CzcD-associated flavoprotein CzcO [Microbacterium sp. BK668]
MRRDVDVLVVGAGISGIGVARAIAVGSPETSFEIVEARDAIGGTWDLFRYPGVRSDSDLYTFGYDFRPWTDDASIASGASILNYLNDTVDAEGLRERIHLRHRVLSGDWSSADARWTVHLERTDTGERFDVTCRWLFCAGGYYRYDRGYEPTLPGIERFAGRVVHPQHWPDDLDVGGRRVVVVGSGATAVTLVPALARTAAHVTMLQRTPTYILPMPSVDPVAQRLRRVFGDRRGHAMARAKSIAQQRALWLLCQRFPSLGRRLIRSIVRKQLPPGYPADVDFNPPYGPWDQRLCLVPDGDLFAALRDGSAEIVTDRIATFTETGVRLESGRELEADIVVTATGLQIEPFGGAALRIDDVDVQMPEHVAYKGLMLDGIPNFAFAIGYTNASWTLKVGLLSDYFVRLLRYMRENAWDAATPARPEGLRTRPLLDFKAGYVQRVVDDLPRQGDRRPWLMSMNYYADVRALRRGRIDDGALTFTRVAASPATDEERFVDAGGGIRICYRVYGEASATPVMLLSGLGYDMYAWPRGLVDGLVAAGLRVIVVDNRDSGRSSRITTRPPTLREQVRGRPPADNYDLSDMAEDARAVLDRLDVDRVHVVGMSMGGMIAQTLAARHPDRVASLTSIFSTTGDPRVGQPARSTKLRMARPRSRTATEYARRHVEMMRHLGSKRYPFDLDDEMRWAVAAWERGGGERIAPGVARQIGAIQKSADRTATLAAVTAPTLVVHGDRDLMVHPSGGRASAAAIRGARHLVIPGLRHHLPPGLVSRLVALITDQVERGESRMPRSGAAVGGGRS